MGIHRHPIDQERRRRYIEANPEYEYSKFDRPYGNDRWSYRVLETERETAWIYSHWSDGSQQDEIKRLALIMYHLGSDWAYKDSMTIEDAWSEDTKYPDPAYPFARSSPSGQCGTTDFLFGMVLGSTNLIDRKNIHYARGELYAADGTLLDPDHAWLHVIGENDLEWRIDFTSHQSAEKNPDPNGFMRIVMQPVQHGMTAHPLINQPPLSRSEYEDYSFPAKNATAIVFKEKARTPIEEYDTRQFKGRLEKLAARSGWAEIGDTLGIPGGKHSFTLRQHGLWFPDTYDMQEEHSDKLETETDDEVRKIAKGLSLSFFLIDHLASCDRYDDLDDYEKECADFDTELAAVFALRANIAHTAMQKGELVITDDDLFSKPHDAKETFEALQMAASGLIGRGTTGALAYQALYLKQKGD